MARALSVKRPHEAQLRGATATQIAEDGQPTQPLRRLLRRQVLFLLRHLGGEVAELGLQEATVHAPHCELAILATLLNHSQFCEQMLGRGVCAILSRRSNGGGGNGAVAEHNRIAHLVPRPRGSAVCGDLAWSSIGRAIQLNLHHAGPQQLHHSAHIPAGLPNVAEAFDLHSSVHRKPRLRRLLRCSGYHPLIDEEAKGSAFL
mmetsp:Transcript_117228/g.261931  ORF Transcript_117228/g.261931 Transcript_117228/m.261931 type:complete len:203 (-) Transcript_117228:95-703(-)